MVLGRLCARFCLFTNASGVGCVQKKEVKKSEALQLILLDNLYAQSGSEHIIFQGGTALRWVYSGMRFSEDLDFVTHLKARRS